MTLTFYPVVVAFSLGQIQVWINALFALAMLFWVVNRKALAGVLIGLISLIKPHFGIFLLWGLFRREWQFIATCAVTLCVGLIASILVFGWANHFDYLHVLSFIAERGETFYPNQSVNGLLNRLMSIDQPHLYKSLAFSARSFPPYNAWVYWGTFISSVILLFAAIAHIRTNGDRVLEFGIMTAKACRG